MADHKELSDEEINQKAVEGALKGYYEKRGGEQGQNPDVQPKIPTSSEEYYRNFESNVSRETDPDLIIGYEKIDLPSKGMFYKNGLSTVEVEYLTSKDEDIMTTPSLIESGEVIDVLLKRKIKTPGVDPKTLMSGDRSAIILFLRASSYGHDYTVKVRDPRNDTEFEETVDLTKLKYKQITEKPDELGEFTVELPMRKKIAKFRLLNNFEEESILKQAETIQKAYSLDYNEYNTMILKACVTEINGKRDKGYIGKFIDAMPARDAYTIRRKKLDVTPEIDMNYEFTAPDGFKFKALLITGTDFFFPST